MGRLDTQTALSHRLKALVFFIRVVLRLKNVGDQPGLQDTLHALLAQLELSWIDPDRAVTKEILDIVLIFVRSFKESTEVVEDGKEDGGKHDWKERNFEKGALTRVVLGKWDYISVSFWNVLEPETSQILITPLLCVNALFDPAFYLRGLLYLCLKVR